MAAGRRGLRPGATAVAAALAVIVAGCLIAWSVASYDGAHRRSDQHTSATAALSTLERRVQGQIQVVGGPVAGLGVLRGAEVRSVLAVPVAPSGAVSLLSGTHLPAEQRLVAAARPAMDVARDTGVPQAAPLADGVVPVVVALFPGSVTPADTAARRAAATGWRIALLSPSGLVAGLPVTSPPAVAVRVNGDLVGPSRQTRSAGTVLLAGQPWTLLMADPGLPLSRGALGTLLATLLGAAACLLSDLRVQRALLAERRRMAALERETRTVAEIGPLLHSSLDLAEVLPAVGLRLADEFGLTRLCVQLIGEKGLLLDVFAIGARPSRADSGMDLVTAGLDDLPAGVLGGLPLLRVGRTIGRLSFAGARDLGQAQLAALSAAADLIAVATYNVELYEREQASVRRLRELDQLKDAFLSTISHELRTPLTAISGFVRLLRDKWDVLREDQRKEFLDRVHGNTLSLGLLVDDLLDFARLEQQTLNAPPSPIDLDVQVCLTLAQLAPVLGARELVSDVQPVRAMANGGALERILANLLTNAAKFSPDASSIRVRVQRADDCALLEVADEGDGIKEDDRDRVFTRFYRGESDAARRTRGAGIGLSVVRELVQQMGGTVSAQPNSPRGTRMVVRLPLAEADDQLATAGSVHAHAHAQRAGRAGGR
ncbi:MAG: hypothetical protein NVS3B26_13230 [Mycobacteriales bacterium]